MRVTRRDCLQTVGRGLAAGLFAGSSSAVAVPAALAGSSNGVAMSAASAGSDYSAAGRTKLSMPGLYPGRVCAIENPAVIASGQYQAAQVQATMRRGMVELTGAGDWQEAWRQFFEPGDLVGIKVNPVGAPRVISDATVLHEIVAGLEAAGVHRHDIVVYDRYRKQFLAAGMDKWLPEGVRMAHAVEDYDDIQQGIQGYDPDHYMDMALTLPGFRVDDVTARRSYAARFITRDVNKLVNLPVLKDHQSAGITMALKNLSHGLVNNVARSHATPSLNACNSFIPAVVALPVIRNKAVLHILDGVKGAYNGGPGAPPQFVWEHKTLYFSTDPVALDHIGWEVIDAQREAVGMKKLVESLPDKVSTFVHRQPEHVEIAGALGLGVWDRNKIDLRQVQLPPA